MIIFGEIHSKYLRTLSITIVVYDAMTSTKILASVRGMWGEGLRGVSLENLEKAMEISSSVDIHKFYVSKKDESQRICDKSEK